MFTFIWTSMCEDIFTLITTSARIKLEIYDLKVIYLRTKIDAKSRMLPNLQLGEDERNILGSCICTMLMT